MGELNENLFTQLLRLLSEEPPVYENLVQEAALKATTVVAQRYFNCNCNRKIGGQVDRVHQLPRNRFYHGCSSTPLRYLAHL